MNSAPAKDVLEFAGFVLDPAQRSLTGEGGVPLTINPKAFDALLYLAERAGTVVERTELYSALWPRTIVDDNNLSQTIAAIRRTLGDTEEQRIIATVPRRGYQLIAPVVRRSQTTAVHSPPVAGQTARIQRTHVYLALAGILAIAAVLVGVYAIRDPSAAKIESRESRRSIAVLPFENLSPNPQDAYFAAGMHEEVLAKISKIQGVTVIGRTSVLPYAKPGSRSVSDIANELGVATLLEGSVRYARERVRVNVRLVDASSGRQLWTETYDAQISDVFGIQSDIATRIATALASELTPTARKQIERPPTHSIAAYAAYLKGLSLYRSSGSIGVSMSPEVRASVQRYLDEALALDPSFATALGWRAQLRADSLQFDSFPIAERAARIAQLAPAVARDARDALEIDPTLGIAYAALSRLHFFDYRLDDALATLDDARKLAPQDSTIWQAAAVLHCIRNEGEQAISAARRAIELDPRNPGPYSLLSIGLRITGRNADALDAYTRMIEVAPTAGLGYVGMARVLTAEGDTPRMRETLKVARQLLGDARNLRLDLALSYAGVGENEDADRLVDEFRRGMEGMYVDPALEAMALLARREHTKAHAVLRQTVADGRRGMDQMPLTLIRYNTWSDPVLDTPEWLALRQALAFKAE